MFCCCSSVGYYLFAIGSIIIPLWVLFGRKTRCYSGVALEQLRDKVVLVTGASSGLGEELAKVFYKHGAKLILASRRLDELERVKRELLITANPVDITVKTYEPVVVSLDLSDPIQTQQVATEKILPVYNGRVDILVNNAGITQRASVVDTLFEVEQRINNVNFLSQIALTKVILKRMLAKQSSSHIVAISSVQGRFAIPYRSSYSSSKHALNSYFDSLRAELSVMKPKVDVTVISPGYIQTNISLNALTSDGSKYGVMDQNTAKGYKAEFVAERTVEAIINKEPEVILGPLPSVVILIRTLCPWLYFYAMSKYAKSK